MSTKYPLDQNSINECFVHIMQNDKEQRELIEKTIQTLRQALKETEDKDTYWQDEAKKIVKAFDLLKVQLETDAFNENGVRRARGMPVKPIYAPKMPEINTGMNHEDNNLFNKSEESFGEPMTEEELEKHFQNIPVRSKKKDKEERRKNDVTQMKTIEEIQEWERRQENSNDIYKIKARVANLAREGGAGLTPVGEMMVNTYVHVLKDLYGFAETIEDKNLKIALIEKIRKHEGMPGNLIAATKTMPQEKKKKNEDKSDESAG